MQTFVPWPSVTMSCRVLDHKRLGKQRVEAFQILCALEDKWALKVRAERTGKTTRPEGWRNHPAVKMWKGSEDFLRYYYNNCVIEWMARGYTNTMPLAPYPAGIYRFTPGWWAVAEVHESHRCMLMRKDPEYYRRKFPNQNEFVHEGYVWPDPQEYQ